MPDQAVVCRCNSVRKAAIVACWRAGGRSVADVVAGTRATTGCGSCRDAVCGIVDWLSTVDSHRSEVAA
jgi:assimilatory nitrate reductase electron transfer subunit